MLTFKQYLFESGKATSSFETKRANQSDIKAALTFVSKALGIEYAELQKDLLGTTSLTLGGKKEDSGDIDIAMSLEKSDVDSIHKKMMAATNDQGTYNAGTKVGSYAVPVNGKNVQVDLMFVPNKDWAKFSYHSSFGDKSKYPGAVRNIILTTALSLTQKPGEDFVLKDDEGRVIARAYKAMTLDKGMERLFKMAKLNPKTGKYNKSLDKVDPKEIEEHLKSLGKNVKFSHSSDATNDPDKVAAHIFGTSVKAKDIMTAEDIIKHIKKLKNASEILTKSKSELERLNLPVPAEL